MRKIATMLVALGLTIGLLGAGISATFTDSVTATQDISVGDFGCKITAATPIGASNGIALDGKSYTAPDILSSVAGSAPFSFTVTATGDIPVVLSASHSALSSPFSSLGNLAPVAMDAGSSHTYNVGLAWSDLTGYAGADLSITYTVDCNEVTALVPQGEADITESPPGTYTIVSDELVLIPGYEEYGPSPETGSIVFTSATSGKLIGDVDYSFDRSGDVVGGAPRFSIPISEGGAPLAHYAFMDVNSCGGATTISTTSATCGVYYASDPMYLNWDAFVAAHPTWSVAAGHLPFVQVDGGLGTFVISNVTETIH
jgi:hypothetical protein